VQANDTSVEVQSEAAKSAKRQLTPGQSWPAEGGVVGSSDEANATIHSKPYHYQVHNHNIDKGAIIGISVGGSIVLLFAGLLFYCVRRSNRYKKVRKQRRPRGATQEQAADENAEAPQSQKQPGTTSIHGSWHNPRVSDVPSISPVPAEGAVFTGYNRQTGAPEFAQPALVGDVKFEEPTEIHPAYGRASFQEKTLQVLGEPQRPKHLPQRRNSLG
jgi:hypothetical protein